MTHTITAKEEIVQKGVLSLAYHDYNKLLNTHAFFKLNDHSLGQDLVQNTFTKTWSYLLKGGQIDTMKAFLYHILNNLIIDEYRKHKASSLDVLLEKGYEPSADDSDRLANILDGKKAFLLIKQLPKIYQEVMKMRYIKDLSLFEISEITGQSKNTIAVQTCRGLERLKILYRNS